MEKKILFIVDGQFDFIEGGKLPVKGGTEALNRLAEYIKAHAKDYVNIVLTADWHPLVHCSFEENGGQWPTHCVEFSHGAAIYQPIIEALKETHADYIVLTKGCDEDHEEYSIFKNEISKTYLETLAKNNDIDTIDYCGLAFDICVANTVKDGLRYFPNAKLRVFKDFCASIDKNSEKDFIDFLNNNERTEIV